MPAVLPLPGDGEREDGLLSFLGVLGVFSWEFIVFGWGDDATDAAQVGNYQVDGFGDTFVAYTYGDDVMAVVGYTGCEGTGL